MSGRTKSLRPPSERGQNEDPNFSDSSQNLSQRRMFGDRLVKINIGGRKFDTTESTLNLRGPNFLSSLVTSQLPSLKDDEGRFFIDRSGTIFEVLLEFLRTGILTIPPHIPQEVRYPISALIKVFSTQFSPISSQEIFKSNCNPFDRSCHTTRL